MSTLQILNGVASMDLSLNRARVLLFSDGRAVTCGEISKALYLSSPDVTGLIDRMERDGLVTRHRNCSTDRRVVFVKNTTDGQEIADELKDLTEN